MNFTLFPTSFATPLQIKKSLTESIKKLPGSFMGNRAKSQNQAKEDMDMNFAPLEISTYIRKRT